MNKTLIKIMTFFLISTSAIYAESYYTKTGEITQIIVVGNSAETSNNIGRAFVKLGYEKLWFSHEDENGKSMLSFLLTAYTTGKQVTVRHTSSSGQKTSHHTESGYWNKLTEVYFAVE